MRSLGRSHSDEEIHGMFSEIDVDGGGRMEFAEFAEFITQAPQTKVLRAGLVITSLFQRTVTTLRLS